MTTNDSRVRTMETKKGVSLRALRPEMWPALYAVDVSYKSQGYQPVVTSTDDGNHRPGSLHYVGLAADFRTRHMSPQAITAAVRHVTEMLADVSPRYQVLLEDDHLHVEYDRRVKR